MQKFIEQEFNIKPAVVAGLLSARVSAVLGDNFIGSPSDTKSRVAFGKNSNGEYWVVRSKPSKYHLRALENDSNSSLGEPARVVRLMVLDGSRNSHELSAVLHQAGGQAEIGFGKVSINNQITGATTYDGLHGAERRRWIVTRGIELSPIGFMDLSHQVLDRFIGVTVNPFETIYGGRLTIEEIRNRGGKKYLTRELKSRPVETLTRLIHYNS